MLLTEKRLRNQRFRRTEATILKVFLAEDIDSLGELALRAKISRSTVYRHHRTLRDVVPDHEAYLLRTFKRTTRRLLHRKGVRMRTLYLHLFLFLLKNQDVIKLTIKADSRKLIRLMIEYMHPKIASSANLTAASLLDIYTDEVTGITWRWCKAGFKESEIPTAINHIIYLTNTARERLRPLIQPLVKN